MSDYANGPWTLPDGRVQWQIWAPRASRLELHLAAGEGGSSRRVAMTRRSVETGKSCESVWQAITEEVPRGQRYGYSIDGGPVRPDPASRWQPDGVHAWSAYWNPNGFPWADQDWRGLPATRLVVYEMHVGTFTPEGTLDAALDHLEELKDLGINTIELMPLNAFPGGRGWGYDGTYWYAVQETYGGPAALQQFVDVCHRRDMAVFLDVVYNHLGPEGNYFAEFAPIESRTHATPWGNALNFDGPDSSGLRRFVIENARFWIREFHLDGLRLDAVHALIDDSPRHLLAEIRGAIHEVGERAKRTVHAIAESNLNDAKLLRGPSHGGYGLDMQWNDDFHHCVHALLTGERDGYYIDFDAPAEQLEKCLQQNFVYDGVPSQFTGRVHGSPATDIAPWRFIASIQTHDQVGNRALGDRFGTLLAPAQQRLAAGLLLLSPFTPMLFMGEEYGETAPFPFFCDFQDEPLRRGVLEGRRREFAAFGWEQELPNPLSEDVFQGAKLKRGWQQNPTALGLRQLYRWLLAFRSRWSEARERSGYESQLVDRDGASMLVVQGGPPYAPPGTQWRACFHLGSSPGAPTPAPSILPTSILTSGWKDDSFRISIHSEEPRFGGAMATRSADDPLPPYAFLLMETSLAADPSPPLSPTIHEATR